MTLQLKIIAITMALLFFVYTVRLIRTDKAEMRQMRKWLIFALVLLIGSFVPGLGSQIAHMLGITTLTSLALFILCGILTMFLLRIQVSLIEAEKKIKVLVQNVSLLKKEVKELKDENMGKDKDYDNSLNDEK